MAKWLEKTLGEVTAFIAKGIPPKYTEEENENTIRVLNQKCNRNFEISYNESRIHDCEKKKVPVDKMLRAGDVLINSTGTGTAGRVAQMVEVTVPTTIDGHMILIRPSEELDSIYYGYAVKSFQSQIEGLAEGSTGQTEINRRRLQDEVIIRYPSDKLVQKNIGSFLANIDEKIKTNKEINKNLYELVNTYYASLFKDAEWEMTTVGNYAERIYSGGTPTTSNVEYWNGSFGWFSSGETRNRFVISTEKTITQNGINNSSTKLASKYDIVMASAGQGFTRGQTSMLLIDTYVNQSVIVIHAERNILPYLFWNLSNRYEELRAISDSSSIRGSLTTKMLTAFKISLVSDETILTFADFAWPIISKIEKNLLENERLTTLRNSLLPKLMSGEIDVSTLEI